MYGLSESEKNQKSENRANGYSSIKFHWNITYVFETVW